MSLISFSPIQDGVTGVNAAATNTPLSTIYNDYNGNITDANISASAAVAFSKIAGGSSTALANWASWTPSYTNLTVGNGTVFAKFVQIGKIVHFYYQLSWGGTTAFTSGSSISISLPVTASSDYLAGVMIGPATFYTSGAAQLDTGFTSLSSSTTLRPFYSTTGSTTNAPIAVGQVNNTGPFSWGAYCVMMLQGTYQAA